MDINSAAAVAQVGSVIFASIAAVWGIWRKMDKKDTESHLNIEIMKEKLEFIQHQFGPNGGGLRQAVNEMSSKVDNIEKRVYNISQDVAKLSGEFHQHIVETDNN